MRRHWGMMLLLSTVLAVAGCVRTAGTPYEPVDEGAVDIATTAPTDLPQSTETPAEAATDAGTDTNVDADAQSADETAIPLTIVVPTETDLPLLDPTATPTVPPSATPIPSATTERLEPSEPPPTEDSAAMMDEGDMDMDSMEEGTDETPIPPTGPSGPVQIAPSTATPLPTLPTQDAVVQPGLQATPTDIGGEADADDATEVVGAGDDGCTLTVRSGDNPFRIAVNNNITLRELQNANPGVLPGAEPVIQPGDVLEIPGCGRGTATITPEPTDAPDLAGATDEPDDTEPFVDAPEGFVEYTVTAGDTLLAVARRYGTTVNDLVEVNDLTNPDVLDVGQTLFVPDPNN